MSLACSRGGGNVAEAAVCGELKVKGEDLGVSHGEGELTLGTLTDLPRSAF